MAEVFYYATGSRTVSTVTAESEGVPWHTRIRRGRYGVGRRLYRLGGGRQQRERERGERRAGCCSPGGFRSDRSTTILPVPAAVAVVSNKACGATNLVCGLVCVCGATNLGQWRMARDVPSLYNLILLTLSYCSSWAYRSLRESL